MGLNVAGALVTDSTVYGKAVSKEKRVQPDLLDVSVSLICASQSMGGTEQIVRLLAAGLHERRANVNLVTISSSNAQWLSTSGVDAKPEPLLESGAGIRKQILGLRNTFRPLRKSVVNIHYPTCDIYRSHILALRLAGCRRIIVSLHHPNLEFGHRTAMNRKILGLCERIVVTTRANRDFVASNGIASDDKITIVAPGVPDQTQLDQNVAREKLDLPKGKFIVGVLCRLEPEKRVREVVGACRIANAGGDEVFLVIAGQGTRYDFIRELATKALGDKFKMVGWVEDANVFYSAIDAYVMLSELEGFGLAYAEAALHGVPSIGCRTGGTPDAIEHGVTGFLVDVENPNSAAGDYLRSWMNSRETLRKMGDAARTRALEHFTASSLLSGYMQLYDKKHNK